MLVCHKNVNIIHLLLFKVYYMCTENVTKFDQFSFRCRWLRFLPDYGSDTIVPCTLNLRTIACTASLGTCKCWIGSKWLSGLLCFTSVLPVLCSHCGIGGWVSWSYQMNSIKISLRKQTALSHYSQWKEFKRLCHEDYFDWHNVLHHQNGSIHVALCINLTHQIWSHSHCNHDKTCK